MLLTIIHTLVCKPTGQIQIKQTSYEVNGSSWMDREWSSSALSKEQSGWDWFALQLSDNSELMFYQLRRKDGNISPNSLGAVFHADDLKNRFKFIRGWNQGAGSMEKSSHPN